MSPKLSGPVAFTLSYGPYKEHPLPKTHKYYCFTKGTNGDSGVLFVVKGLNEGWQKELYLGEATNQPGLQFGEVTVGKMVLRGRAFYSEDLHPKRKGIRAAFSDSRLVRNPYNERTYMWHHESSFNVSNITLMDPETKEVFLISKEGKKKHDNIEMTDQIAQHLEFWMLSMLMYRRKLEMENKKFADNVGEIVGDVAGN
ncbi:hypothetical protein MNV49_006031 [Pseudohyphozyma bogoriensis]|nr:hypothetical protein MNV49_006031 [Pseudohyphozyma bogoriensis]